MTSENRNDIHFLNPPTTQETTKLSPGCDYPLRFQLTSSVKIKIKTKPTHRVLPTGKNLP
ncbi:MAG: hypothetical protein E3J94_03625 [Desulfobacteraceae bacterium]|nr:MAG: hypothetical protein E3J94_03625 [Desulfobacteraceae bacterium]